MASKMNLYQLDRPAVVSFSGGRTSGYMLWHILQAFGGTLPADVVPIFCNTGKERPETLDFVERCSQRWGVEIVWLEYCKATPHKFLVMSYASASRNGQPFDQIISRKEMLPNVVMRYCTQWLKIKVSNRYARHVLGWKHYRNAIGLRADEPRRVAKLRVDPKSSPGEEPIAPLAQHNVSLGDVQRFWAAHPFDLALAPHEGNCDLCFLKKRSSIDRILRDRPELAAWWIDKEKQFVGKTRIKEVGRFRKDRPSYEQMLRQAQEQPMLFADEDYPDCRCTD